MSMTKRWLEDQIEKIAEINGVDIKVAETLWDHSNGGIDYYKDLCERYAKLSPPEQCELNLMIAPDYQREEDIIKVYLFLHLNESDA